jgi:DNA-binding transcriptional LysR family regulator
MPLATLRRYFRHGLFPQLVVFEAVARLGSVTRAANELHLAQPTVSMQLKKLSQTLEVTLFEPDGRGVRITPAGEALLAERGQARADAVAGWLHPLDETELRVVDTAVTLLEASLRDAG